jgi:hypothetical protein
MWAALFADSFTGGADLAVARPTGGPYWIDRSVEGQEMTIFEAGQRAERMIDVVPLALAGSTGVLPGANGVNALYRIQSADVRPHGNCRNWWGNGHRFCKGIVSGPRRERKLSTEGCK